MRRAAAWFLPFAQAVLVLAASVCPGEEAAPKTVGWRGNWTGLFPEANPPTEWARIAKGVVAGMTCQAARPAEGAAAGGRPLDVGLPRDWLIVGPFGVADSVKEFEAAQVPGEADLAPAEGDKAGEAVWQRLELLKKPDYERWGTTELDWVDPGEVFGIRINQVAYAHTYLHCERPGRVLGVVDHGYGLKVWLNGEAVYSGPKRDGALGSYVGISHQKQALTNTPSPRFEMTFRKGWNRLLVKVSTANVKGYREMKFAPRFYDPEPVPYQEKNIVWVARLPERSNAPPIVVGDRLFVSAEPDELLCLDKKTGRTLWRRINGHYEATPEADRAAKPVFKEKIAPLAEQLYRTTDYDKGLELRRQIQELLVAADEAKYKMKWDGHLAAHFGIVGFSTNPVSDGRRVYVFYGQGVAACYDLDGNRVWIARLEAPEIRYSCSPALAGGRLITVFGGMQALDAETGKVAWKQPEITSIASLIPGRIAGTDVVSTREGQVVRAADGKVLWRNPHIQKGDTGWAAPTFIGDVLYVPWYGVTQLIVADFAGVSGDAWQPKVRVIELEADHRRPNGEWLDRSTACSPVVYEGRYYNLDQYGVFYAADLASGKTLYKKDLGFDELHHYNGIGVGASAALGGKHLYAIDNQGTCVVLEPGPEFKQVAVNRIETVLQRQWPLPTQETLANAAPVFDGDRMYLRGEQYLYCIGKHDGPAARPGEAQP
jgi:outer membrane protein assembly factor BamB